MGTLRLGLITTYMSDPLVSGFTTAAGVYGGTGQMKHIFGITIPRSYGMFQIVTVGFIPALTLTYLKPITLRNSNIA